MSNPWGSGGKADSGYEVFYGGPKLTGSANPYTWEQAAKCIKFHKQNHQIKYIFCIGPYGGGRRLVYRALRGLPGWCAASHCPYKHLLNVPMQTTAGGPQEVIGPVRPVVEQIESD